MKLMTQDQVEALCLDIGMIPKNARIGSAVAMCESATVVSGKVYADFGAIGDQELANEKWGYSYGGFQIRSLRAEKGTGGWRDEDLLLRPRFNCRAARAIMRASGWSAWSTYRSGMYKAYLQEEYPPPPSTYVVVYGDTLSRIGVKLGIPWEELARINGLHSPYRIYIGQHLKLP
jgi:hypothetical protein